MEELASARVQVRDGLRRLEIDAWTFEGNAGARPDTIQKTFLTEVADADIYIGIFWKGYGRYTIEEFEHARRCEKPCFVYQKQSDLDRRDPELQDFLNRIAQVEVGVTPRWFIDDADLVKRVCEDVQRYQAEIVRNYHEFNRVAIDDRIENLVPAVDPELADHLREAISELRRNRDAVKSIRALVPFFQKIARLLGCTSPESPSKTEFNFDTPRATEGLPAEIIAEFDQFVRISNIVNQSEFCGSLKLRDGEIGIVRAFGMFEWYCCEYTLGPRLASIYRRESRVRSMAFVDPPASDSQHGREDLAKLRFAPELDSRKSGQGIDQIVKDWCHFGRHTNPMTFVAHFAPDIRETLLELSSRMTGADKRDWSFQRVQWVYGENLVDLADNQRQELARVGGPAADCRVLLAGMIRGFSPSVERARTIFEDMRSLPDSLFVFDFSSLASPFENDRANSEERFKEIVDALRRFAQWISSNAPQHGIVIGIPRWLLSFSAWLELAEGDATDQHCFFATELFTSRITDGAKQFQAHTGFPLPQCLTTLVNANSPTLRGEIIRFFQLHHEALGSQQRLSASHVLQLAAQLLQKGYFEVAYRLELYCRTCDPGSKVGLEGQARVVSMDFEISALSPGDAEPSNSNRARLRGQHLIPQAIARGKTRAVISGESGAGKSCAIQDIQRSWCLPPRRVAPRDDDAQAGVSCRSTVVPVSLRGRWCPSWLPVQLPLSDHSGESVEEQLRATHRRTSQLEGPAAECGQATLRAHRIAADVNQLADYHWLFVSPVLLLVDNIDGLSRDARRAILRHLDDVPAIGVVLGSRTTGHEEKELFADEARIRPMNEQQIEELLKICLTDHKVFESVQRLLELIDKPISGLIRNPYLLTKVCRVASNYERLEDFTLHSLLDAYVQDCLNRDGTENAQHTVYDWLPRFALQQKKNPGCAVSEEDAWYLDSAEALGFVTAVDSAVKFQHDLLRDYFAANEIKYKIEEDGVSGLTATLPRRKELWGTFENVLRIVVGAVWADNLGTVRELIAFLAMGKSDVGYGLAFRCLMELPLPEARELAQTQGITESLSKTFPLSTEFRDERHRELAFGKARENAMVLGALDPRIPQDAPEDDADAFINAIMENMVQIHSVNQVSAFHVGTYPVTNLEFARFIQAGGYQCEELWQPFSFAYPFFDVSHPGALRPLPRYWRNSSLNLPNAPVVGVSIYEALAYCNWLSSQRRSVEAGIQFHLPTDTQWYLVLGLSDLSIFKFITDLRVMPRAQAEARSDDEENAAQQNGDPRKSTEGIQRLAQIAQELSEQSFRELQSHLEKYRSALTVSGPSPIGLFAPGDNGCHDLIGNVWEWCDTWFRVVPTTRPSLSKKEVDHPVVVMGGPVPPDLAVAWVVSGGWFSPYVRAQNIGFRICYSTTS